MTYDLLSPMLVLGVLMSVPMVAPPQDAGTKLDPFSETLPSSLVKVDMVPIPGGTVTVGGKKVTVKPFFIAKTETPWEAYDVFISSGAPSPAYDQTAFGPDVIARPSKSYILPDLGWGHTGWPVINVSSTSVDMFCRWMSSVTKKKYRMPTEAEWELACRAGDNGAWKMDASQLDKAAWYAANAKGMTHQVGKKAANKFGLFDMLGNTGEWATDIDGKSVVCGGSFRDGAAGQTPMVRHHFDPSWQETDPQIPKSRWWLADAPFAGFRLVCEP